jgi:toxin ParE1/3/4
VTQGSGSSRLLLREAAVNDLDELAAHIQQDSPQSAIRFLEATQETFDALARRPELGGLFESHHQLLAGTLVWQVKDFRTILVFYRPVAGGVEIIRVLYGARDFAALFDEEG